MNEQTIDRLTVEHLGDQATDADLAAFKAACWAYWEQHDDVSEQDAIDAVWNDGDFAARVEALTA